MFGRIKKGWELTKRSFRVIKEDKEILFFPILSSIILTIISAFFVLLWIFFIGPSTPEQGLQAMVVIFLILWSICFYLTSTFFKSAIISSATIRLSGKNPSFSDGLKTPFKKIGKVFSWAIVLVVVNIVIGAIRGSNKENKSLVEQVARDAAAKIAETAWNLLTYFVIPILLFEDAKLWDATKKSTELFKKTWGESLTSQFSVGIIFSLAGTIIFLPCLLLILTFVPTLIILGILIFLPCVILLAVLKTSVEGILVASLYFYATKNKIPKVFEGTDPKELFKKK